MAYVKRNFVDFVNIKLIHFHGKSHTNVMPDVQQWITDNPGYRYVDAFVNYIRPWGVTTPVTTEIETTYNVEVTIVYTEG